MLISLIFTFGINNMEAWLLIVGIKVKITRIIGCVA
jgi:hypothetical protein